MDATYKLIWVVICGLLVIIVVYTWLYIEAYKGQNKLRNEKKRIEKERDQLQKRLGAIINIMALQPGTYFLHPNNVTQFENVLFVTDEHAQGYAVRAYRNKPERRETFTVALENGVPKLTYTD